MSTSSSTPAKQSTQSSGSEKTPDSGTSRTKRAYTKSCNSPSLRAFDSFGESLAKFFNYVLTKIDHIGTDSVDMLGTELERLHNKCKSMEEEFQCFISHLDKAINEYETKKPTGLAADANSVISPEEQAANRSSLFKDKNTIDTIFTALNQCIANIYAVIMKKIRRSVYDDPYSISLEKKLKKLKNMCEANSNYLEEIGKKIKDAIDKNEGIRRSNDECIK